MAKGTVNKVIILGRLGQDPDVRATAGGTQVATISVATNELGRKDENGNRGEDVTEWHRCVLWGRVAEIAAQYLKKGSLVYIEGRLQTRKWQDNQGQDRYTTEIVANEMQLMGGRDDNQGQQYQYQHPQQQQQAQPQQGQPMQQPTQQQPQPPGNPAQQQQGQPGGMGFDDFDSDIPF